MGMDMARGGKKNIRAQCARCLGIVYSAFAAMFPQVGFYVPFSRSAPTIPGRGTAGTRSRHRLPPSEFRSRRIDLPRESKPLSAAARSLPLLHEHYTRFISTRTELEFSGREWYRWTKGLTSSMLLAWLAWSISNKRRLGAAAVVCLIVKLSTLVEDFLVRCCTPRTRVEFKSFFRAQFRGLAFTSLQDSLTSLHYVLVLDLV